MITSENLEILRAKDLSALQGQERDFLAPLAVRKFPGIGPTTEARLKAAEGFRILPVSYAKPLQSEYLPANTICILDLFHVLERLWKVAWCFFEEKAQKRQAHQWVEERLRRLLEGKVDAVVRGMRYQATQRGLKGQERKTVRGAAEYFERNRDRMKYDEYLAAGYPIGSGVVEGACRHLVKDRLERAGMRWIPDGAQAMLDLRATYLNGEWEAFWVYHVEQEDNRLYRNFRKTG